ncbi:MAG: two-component regulator propeller domain-containing protein [Muribaculaceae bacterium]
MKAIRLIALFIVGVVVSATSMCLASPNYRFTHITTIDGLPHQQITSIMQDNIGRMWIGTRNGLVCYDGYEITPYFNEAGNEHSLINSSVSVVYQDSKQRIWVATEGGLCRYRADYNDFQRYELPTKLCSTILELHDGRLLVAGVELYLYDEKTDSFEMIKRSEPEFIISLAEDRQGRIFVSTNNSIFYYDNNLSKTTQLSADYFSDFVKGYDGIIPLRFDSQGLLWIGRNGKGVMRVNLTTGEKHIYDVPVIGDGTVRVITEDSAGRVWLGTEKGLSIINSDGTVDILKQNYIDKTNLNDNAIYSIVCDRDNNVWIGTYFGGINLLLHQNEQFNWIQPGYNNHTLSGKAVRKIIEYPQGRLVIATEDGGINFYDIATAKITTNDKFAVMGSNVHTLLKDSSSDDMWIGTFRRGLFRLNTRSGTMIQYLPGTSHNIASDAIFDIVQQRRTGRVWFGTTQGLFYLDKGSDELQVVNHDLMSRYFSYCLLVDSDDNLWCGMRSYGVFRIDSRTGEITAVGGTMLAEEYVTALYQDDTGKIWIGTNTDGLYYVEPSGMKVQRFQLDEALMQSTICSITGDRDGNLWVSSSVGLFRINRPRNEVKCYTVDDGLPTNQFNYASAIIASDGMLYMGTINGLISFDPTHMADVTRNIDVHLLKLIIDDKEQTASTPESPLTDVLDKMEKIELSNSQSHSFSIQYAVIMPGNANSIYYQTRLLGSANQNWSTPSRERKFVGSNLPSGSYTLQVRANMSNTGWNEAQVKEIKIVVHPPIYKTVWAYCLYALLLAVAIYYLMRFYNTRLRERNEVRLAKLEKEQLEVVNKIKLDFFTTVSHELKTPLSLIISPLKRVHMHRETLPKSDADMLDTALKNSEKILELIDELVTFNKVETGTFRFYLQYGNPLEFIESLTHLFVETAREKSIELTTWCENNGEEVWFSPSYVERIMSNLLTNALKYTSQGGMVKVLAAITGEANGHTMLHIEIKDTGIGIASEELPNIFNPYYQTKRGHTKNHKGWGLGLALVKKLVEIHGGTVRVESEIGKGTTFIVDLRVDDEAFDASLRITPDKSVVSVKQYEFSIPSLANAKAAKEVKPREIQSKPCVLLVEDDEELLGFLATIFEPSYNIHTATNGKMALDYVMCNQVDLVISDVMMPEMDGTELCRRLKQNISTSHIPVILLTAKNDTKDIMEGYESGADAYVQKPFDPQILELQVNNILRLRVGLRDRMMNAGEATKVEDIEVKLTEIDRDFINRINDIIDNSMDNEQFSVADITKIMGVSRSLLHVKMKSLLNISTGDYVRKRRLARACTLLKEGFNVSETSYRIGFSEPNYFSKVFKKEFGVSPTEWVGKETGTAKDTADAGDNA